MRTIVVRTIGGGGRVDRQEARISAISSDWHALCNAVGVGIGAGRKDNVMISNATRLLCAVLSTIGAAGLVVFANPANAIGTSQHAVAAPVVAAAPVGIAARG